MKGLAKLLEMKYGELIFGLVCGCSYFIIALDFIFSATRKAGGLLALFVAPLIICGVALVFIKIIRKWRQQEQYYNINSFIIVNFVMFVISIFFLIDFIIN